MKGFVSVMLVFVAQAGMSSTTPDRLQPCPSTPNCVSTQADSAEQRMEPIPYKGDLDSARTRLLDILRSEPRVSVDKADELYIHAVFTSAIFRFKDDVEFLFDEERRLIHFRSASRVGRSDMGVNRERMERISARFAAAQSQRGP